MTNLLCPKCKERCIKRGHRSGNNSIPKYYCKKCDYWFEKPLLPINAVNLQIGVNKGLREAIKKESEK